MTGNSSPGKILKKTRESVGLSTAIGQKKHGSGFPGYQEGIYSETMGQGDAGGYPPNYPLKYPAVNYGEQDGVTDIDIDLTKFFSHVTRITLTGDLTITFSNPPAVSKAMLIFFEITQDAIGGRTITWPLGMLPTPTLNSGANAKTLIAMFSTDQGATWHTQTFGSVGGGGSGDANTPWTENQNASEFELLNLGKLQFQSSLNYLQITREGSPPGYDILATEAPFGLDYYINRSLNPIPRFSVLENSVDVNVLLDLNDQIIDKVNRIQFGAAGNEGTIDSSPNDISINTNVNSEFRVKQGGTTRLEMDDLTKDLIMTGLDVTIEGGRIFSVDDFSPGNAIQMFVLFGEQHINAASALRLQVAGSSLIELDSFIQAFADLDLQENDIRNIKTMQIEEEFAAGFAPSGITDNAILFCRPSAGGKTELRVKFQTGTSQLLAVEA